MSLRKTEVHELKTEVLVIGSEAAGAKAAIEALEEGSEVMVVTKGLIGRGGDTIMAGPAVQSPLGLMDPRDNPDVFFEDVVKGGDYLNNQELVEKLVHLAITEVPKLEKWGARFEKHGDKLLQTQVPGSSYPRTLNAIGFHGGRQWRTAFWNQFRRLNTTLIEDTFITSLLMSNGQVAGAFGISLRDGNFVIFRSKVTILATGGCPQIYLKTDSSIAATGDGMILAYRAGGELMDMEFQQFFPLCCYTPPFEMSNFTGHLRYSLRGMFYNSMGEAFMKNYLPGAEDWGLRDPTSRAIYMENMYGRGSTHGGAYLSFRHLPTNLIDDFIRNHNPPYIAKFEKAGIDIKKHALEVGPGAHYSMGGVRVNKNCETSLPRLYAAGEVAAGMDGAERIDGGPAITWCLTMGYVAGKEAAGRVKDLDWLNIEEEQVRNEQKRVREIFERKDGIKGFEVKNKVKEIMWSCCALVRNREGMERGLTQIQRIKSEDIPRLYCSGESLVFNKGCVEALESLHMTYISEMVIRSALMREETRKSHYRTDFPKRDNQNWLKNISIIKDGDNISFQICPSCYYKVKP